MNPRFFERRHFRMIPPLPVGHNRARVPQYCRRSKIFGKVSRDNCDNGLCEFSLRNETRGFFLVRSADLAEKNNRFCRGVLLKKNKEIREIGSDDRVAADSHCRALPDSLTRKKNTDFRSHAAAFWNNADVTRGKYFFLDRRASDTPDL